MRAHLSARVTTRVRKKSSHLFIVNAYPKDIPGILLNIRCCEGEGRAERKLNIF